MQGEQDNDGEQQPIQSKGADAGDESFLVPGATFGLLPHPSGEEPGQQGDAQEDENAAGDVPRGGADAALVKAQPARQHVEVEPAEAGEGDDLEDRVQGDQYGGGLPVTAGQVVPDDHHGDAASKPDDDQAGAVRRKVGQEYPGEGEHQRGAEDPVHQQRADQQPAVAGDGVEPVVADLGQHRVHHDQQPDRDRQADAIDLHGLKRGLQTRHDPAQQQPGQHGHADPHRQETVEGGELGDHGVRRDGGSGHGHRHTSTDEAALTGWAEPRSEEPSTADSWASAEGTTQ